MKVEALKVGFIDTNCYIAHNGNVAVIIDPGADADGILRKADELGVAVKYIFLTHAHFDHVLAVSEIIKRTGAVLVAHEGERVRLADPEVSGHSKLRGREFVPLTADREISDGESIDVGDMHFEFIHTPGHTEGSVCIICEDTMFPGDTLFAGTCGRCDLAGGDFEEMLRTLRKLGELDGDYNVLPGHEEATTLSRERRYNPYMTEAKR